MDLSVSEQGPVTGCRETGTKHFAQKAGDLLTR